MTRKTWTLVVASATLALSGLGVQRLATAQQDGPPPPPGGGPGGFPGGGGFGRFGGGGTQMAASGNNLFVLRGGTLYRIDATTLKVAAVGQLPADPNMQRGPSGAGGQGQRRFRRAPGEDAGGAPPPPPQ